jgi:hypothetical protein
MKIQILFLLINVFLSSVIDRNGIKFVLPEDWDGRWTLGQTTYKFKPDYMFSIGEGMIKKIKEDECNRLRDNMRNRNDLMVNGYRADKAINIIDMYGVSVNEFVTLVNDNQHCYLIKAFYEMSIAEDMEKGLMHMLNSILIKN